MAISLGRNLRRTASALRALPAALYLRARYGQPRCLLWHASAPGDDILCTTALRELRRRGAQGLWMLTRHPDLFRYSPDVDRVLPYRPLYARAVRLLGARAVFPEYAPLLPGEDRCVPPARHILALICAAAGVTGRVELRPYLYLHEDEKPPGRRAGKQIAIQSSGLAARSPMRNKEWFPERFQEVVNRLRERYTFVQIGKPQDPPLEHAVDLRGQTSARALAAVLAQSLLFVGLVGFPMHLARAVDCRSVIVYGGREKPEQSGYPCNENLYSLKECSPCWRYNSCAYERECLSRITAAEVVAAVERLAARAGTPLETAWEDLPGT